MSAGFIIDHARHYYRVTMHRLAQELSNNLA